MDTQYIREEDKGNLDTLVNAMKKQGFAVEMVGLANVTPAYDQIHLTVSEGQGIGHLIGTLLSMDAQYKSAAEDKPWYQFQLGPTKLEVRYDQKPVKLEMPECYY